MHVKIIAEIGINHNGDLEIAKQLIDGAKLAGVTRVKFQKRTVDIVYSKEELDKERVSPGAQPIVNRKKVLSFPLMNIKKLIIIAREKKCLWFFSAWDLPSQRLMD